SRISGLRPRAACGASGKPPPRRIFRGRNRSVGKHPARRRTVPQPDGRARNDARAPCAARRPAQNRARGKARTHDPVGTADTGLGHRHVRRADRFGSGSHRPAPGPGPPRFLGSRARRAQSEGGRSMSSEVGPPQSSVKRVGIRDVRARKGRAEKLVVLTAYDALFARLVDESGVDIVLVGDSAGTVLLGYETTIPVTLDQMIDHAAAARRGVKRALLTVDMPFLTYQVSAEQAVINCGRVMQESGADSVKMEGGGADVLRAIRAVTDVGIPVMGHLGYTPQSEHSLGRSRVQGREERDAAALVEQAKRVEDAGAFAIVLELIPAALARAVTGAVTVPTIGIGAGGGCDGQVLVLHDLVGLNDRFTPKFLKRYATLAEDVRSAVRRFGDDVRAGRYPDD